MNLEVTFACKLELCPFLFSPLEYYIVITHALALIGDRSGAALLRMTEKCEPGLSSLVLREISFCLIPSIVI